MLRTVSLLADPVRKLLQNLPARGAIMGAFPATWLPPRIQPQRMKSIVLALALSIATAATAQAPSVGPAPAPSRTDLWQLLTPEQRDQLWRSLPPEQRSDVWRGLQPQERREMRERLGSGAERGAAGPWAGWRQLDRGDAPGKTMTPEERQQMREQVREAHRLRRERLEAERARPSQ
jgi:hypothetical protein